MAQCLRYLRRCSFQPFPASRRPLAIRAKVAAPSRHNRTPDCFLATKAGFTLSSVRTMVPLIFSGHSFGVKKIGNRRSSQLDCLSQNLLQFDV
jgi:hypothetical protein